MTDCINERSKGDISDVIDRIDDEEPLQFSSVSNVKKTTGL